MDSGSQRTRTGYIFGVSSYILWGFFPLYWPYVKPASAFEILSHRIVWSIIFCTFLLAFRKSVRASFSLLTHFATFKWLVLSSIALSINWGVFIWAVNNAHTVDSALGYYINPLVLILFGVVLYKERLSRWQWVAVALGTISVVILAIDYGTLPWIALTLAFSFGSYGLLKKHMDSAALETFNAETMVIGIPALFYLLYLSHQGTGQFGHGTRETLMLAGAGIVTTVPLLLFNGATTRLPLSMIGLLQYINPSIQFIIGVLVRHEKMSTTRWICFGLIWSALAILTFDGLRSRKVSGPLAEVE